MKKIHVTIILSFFTFSCGSWLIRGNIDTKNYEFEFTTVASDFEITKQVELYLPRGGKVKKTYPRDGGIYIEHRVTFPDSSVFYVSNDIWNGSDLNVANLMSIGINGHTKEKLLDSVSYSGGNNRFWKEQFVGEVVLGYVNASSEMKNVFNQAILETQIQ